MDEGRQVSAHDADEIDARAYELEARAAELHAKAARLRAASTTKPASAGADWIPLGKLPIAKKTARALAKSAAFVTRKVNGRTYVERTSFEAFMRGRESTPATNGDAALRAELGLAPKAATR